MFDKAVYDKSSRAASEAVMKELHTFPIARCENGNIFFHQETIIKSVPGLVAGTGATDVDMPMAVTVCSKCGKVLPHQQGVMDNIPAELLATCQYKKWVRPDGQASDASKQIKPTFKQKIKYLYIKLTTKNFMK
jgi:hypothetical protein